MKLAGALLLVARVASAQDVKVVDASGELAYIASGSADGLREGMVVTFGDREATVVATNAHSAALSGSFPIGATGTFVAAPRTAPRPESAFVEQWPKAEPPAAHASVVAIALPPQISIEVLGTTYAVAGGDAEAEARVIASFDHLTEAPLGADLDASARWYSTGANRFEHTPLLVHAAQLRYGTADDPDVVIGRLRYAASSLGVLDGGRAAIHTGAFELAAFGGLIPDPVSGKPTTDASQFGAEMIYGTDTLHLAATAYASTWQGTLDEKRLAVVSSYQRGHWRFDEFADAQAFSSGNPWGAPSVQVTGAGESAVWRDGNDHTGIDITFLRPDRSLRLAAALPPDWLCTSSVADDLCHGGDWWLATTFSAGTRIGPWAFDVITSLGATHGRSTSTDISGYLRADRSFGIWRAIFSAAAGRVDFAQFESVEVGIGVAPSRTLDASLSYRPERLVEEAADARIVHQGVAELRLAISRRLAIALSALGSSDSSLAVLATIAWRPR